MLPLGEEKGAQVCSLPAFASSLLRVLARTASKHGNSVSLTALLGGGSKEQGRSALRLLSLLGGVSFGSAAGPLG